MLGHLTPFYNLTNWKQSPECSFTYLALFICYILLTPLYMFVLYLGLDRWRKQRSGSTSETSSHSDIITYNMVAVEMISIMGFCFYANDLFGYSTAIPVWSYLWVFVTPAEYLFHNLTCVDRYLAVVHPVIYLRLKQSGGVRIRNISIGCIWLICFAALGSVNRQFRDILNIVFKLLSFIIVSFCSLSVLRVLIHPGPGDVSGNRGRVDQSKKRAFQTIMMIMATLMLRILSRVVYSSLKVQKLLSYNDDCVLEWSLAWFSVPSSLVLPLLFLHRKGKLPSCKTNSESG